MPNSRHSGAIFSPSSRRAINFSRSSMGLHAFQGILRSPQKARLCNPCLRYELSPFSQEGQRCLLPRTPSDPLTSGLTPPLNKDLRRCVLRRSRHHSPAALGPAAFGPPMKNAKFVVVSPQSGKWIVEVAFSDTKRRRITGFTLEAVAAEWIAKASAVYLRNLRKPCNPLRRREKTFPGKPKVTKTK